MTSSAKLAEPLAFWLPVESSGQKKKRQRKEMTQREVRVFSGVPLEGSIKGHASKLDCLLFLGPKTPSPSQTFRAMWFNPEVLL